jgi:hypothetical protein
MNAYELIKLISKTAEEYCRWKLSRGNWNTFINPRADGAKRRARVLIPPAIYTRWNESISEV